MNVVVHRRSPLWTVLAVGATAPASYLVLFYPVIAGSVLGAAAAVWVSFIFAERGKLYLIAAVWLGATYSVPYWLSISVKGVTFPPSSLVAFLLILGGLCGLLRRTSLKSLTVEAELYYILSLVGVLVFVLVGNLADFRFVLSLSVNVLPALVLGIIVASDSRLMQVISLATSYIAAWSVIERVAGWHPFVHLTGPVATLNHWAELQGRAGEIRSEAAFGHAISLGGALAIGLPFVLVAGRKAQVLLVLVGVGATLSRGPLISAGVVLALAAILVLVRREGRSYRFGRNSIFGFLVGLCSVPIVLSFLANAGDEAAGSAAYRGSIWTEALPLLRFAGTASSTLQGDSVDSAVLVYGLNLGMFPTLVFFAPIFLVAVHLLSGGKSSPTYLSLVAIVPLCLTVALITQLGAVVGFFFGLALASWASSRRLERLSRIESAVSP